MGKLSQQTLSLISSYKNWQESLRPREGAPFIHVDEVASKVATFYEKIRGVVDWREEHLLRKTAIERIIKRRLFIRKNGEKIATPLVYELIRGGHFPNDTISEPKIEEVQKLIDKYVFIMEKAPSPPKEKMKAHLYDWILGIAACEIEEILAPPIRERALIDYMYELMKERIEISEGIFVFERLPEEEKNLQIYIAIQKALFNLDPPLISYSLLRWKYPKWTDLPVSQLSEIAKNIYFLWEKIEKDLKHSLAEKFYKVCEKYDTSYLILGDIISQDPNKIHAEIENPEILENMIREKYKKRLKTVKIRVKRAAIYSTISIFITKMLFALSIEIPFDKYFTGEYNHLAILLSVIIPPLLMVLIVISNRPPSKSNEQKVVLEVIKITYEGKRKDVYLIKRLPKRGFILNSVIFFIYLFGFAFSFGTTIFILQKLHFGIISIIIFLMFISLISFAGVKIRQRAKEMIIEERKETFFRIFFDLLSLPIIQVGKWLSGQWSKYNVLVVLLNSLIDMPFQLFVEFLEQLRYFLQEKREKIH